MNIAGIKSKTVALAPFNAISMALSALLEEQGIRTAVIYDNNRKLHGRLFGDIPLRSAADDNLDGMTVIVCSFISLKQIRKQLVQLNAHSVIPYEDIVDRGDLPAMLAAFEKIKSNHSLEDVGIYHKNVMFGSGDLSIRAALPPVGANSGIILPLVTVIATEVCNLRCAECSHLMQYFTKPRTYSADIIMRNFDRLYNATKFIRLAAVSGGEPLLHKDLASIILRLAAYENIGYIVLSTNSTIMPDEKFFKSVSKIDNLMIRASDYGEPSKYKEEIAGMCVKYGIRHAVLGNATWYGGLRISEINDDFDDVQHIFGACSTKDMLLAEHSFAKCHLALFADKLGAIPDGLPGMRSCLDVSADGFSADTLRGYLNANEPLQTCSICTGASRTREQIPAGIQTNKPLSYKRYK